MNQQVSSKLTIEITVNNETDTSMTTKTNPATKIRPPFTAKTARAKVQAAEDGWNSRDPHRVAMAYTEHSEWRNRDQFFTGREAIIEFLANKWSTELDYQLMKELWAFTGNRISVRFEYEWHDEADQWHRTHGNEHWEFETNGLMSRRDMSANDTLIDETDRRLFATARP